jgi:hypothetical protein
MGRGQRVRARQRARANGIWIGKWCSECWNVVAPPLSRTSAAGSPQSDQLAFERTHHLAVQFEIEVAFVLALDHGTLSGRISKEDPVIAPGRAAPATLRASSAAPSAAVMSVSARRGDGAGCEARREKHGDGRRGRNGKPATGFEECAAILFRANRSLTINIGQRMLPTLKPQFELRCDWTRFASASQYNESYISERN